MARAKLALALAAGVLVCGCSARTPASLHVVDQALDAGRRKVPDELKACLAEPRSPGGRATDHQAASYVLDLVEAGRDCRRKHAAVVGIAE